MCIYVCITYVYIYAHVCIHVSYGRREGAADPGRPCFPADGRLFFQKLFFLVVAFLLATRFMLSFSGGGSPLVLTVSSICCPEQSSTSPLQSKRAGKDIADLHFNVWTSRRRPRPKTMYIYRERDVLAHIYIYIHIYIHIYIYIIHVCYVCMYP